MTYIKINGENARGRRGSTDWNKVKTMTDEEIKKSAMLDPDAKEIRDDELASFRRSNR